MPVEFFDRIEANAEAGSNLEQRDLIALLRARLDVLPPALRSSVDASLQGLNPAEIAAEQGVHPTTIRTRLYRARTYLRRHLTPGRDARQGISGCDPSVP